MKPQVRDPSLDGLRGLAIALVLIRHFFDVAIQARDASATATWFKKLFLFSFGGVELFFVLSGFLLGRILLKEPITNRVVGVFYWKRVLRIMPCYGLLLAGFLAVRASPLAEVVYHPVLFDDRIPFWSYLIFTQNHFMAALHDLGPYWLVITWSLAVEVQFYLFIPWLMRGLRPRGFVVFTALSLAISTLLRWLLVHRSNKPFSALYSTTGRVTALFAGVALAILWSDPAWREKALAWRRPIGVSVILLIGMFFILPFGRPPNDAFDVVWAPLLMSLGFVVVLLGALLHPDHAMTRIGSGPALRGLGTISYFVYLFHFPIIFICYAGRSPSDEPSRIWATLLALTITVALGAASWRWFEAPIVRLGQRAPARQRLTGCPTLP